MLEIDDIFHRPNGRYIAGLSTEFGEARNSDLSAFDFCVVNSGVVIQWASNETSWGSKSKSLQYKRWK